MAQMTATYVPSLARKTSRGAKDAFVIFVVALSLVLLAVSFLGLSNGRGSPSGEATQPFEF